MLLVAVVTAHFLVDPTLPVLLAVSGVRLLRE